MTPSALLELGLRTTLVLAIPVILSAVLARGSARARTYIWKAALLSVLVSPLVSSLIRWLGMRTIVLETASRLWNGAGEIAPVAAASLNTWAIPILWAAVSSILLFRLAIAHLSVWRRVRPHSRGKSLLVRSAAVQSPCVWGFYAGRILLPASFEDRSREQRIVAIRHELGHVANRDCFWQLIANLATAIYWWHPLAWYAAARLQAETEFACDELVLAKGVKPSAYAETLLAFAAPESRTQVLCPVTLAVARRTSIGHRIERILTMTPTLRWTRAGAVCAMLAGLLVIPISAMQAGKVYKIGGDVKPPVLITKVEPEYTQDAKDAKVEGAVVLQVIIDQTGSIQTVEVLKGLDPGLDQNAVTAVKSWKMKPAMKGDEAVSVQARVEVNFRLK